MEVKLVSSEIVKPSSPTAKHLKTYKRCSIDQAQPRAYIPAYLFYQKKSPPPPSSSSSEEEEEEEGNRLWRRLPKLLKLSLSRLLTFFYPFAGTISDDVFSVICDDRGVPFTLAKANFPLAAFLRQPDYGRLPGGFFPEQLENDPAGCLHVTVVQLNQFSCGGFVICAAFSHLIADASSVCFFLKSWAAMHRHDRAPKPAIFNASSLFPPAERVPKEVEIGHSKIASFMKQMTVGKRRLLYGPAAVRALKEKASLPDPTRAQVVSAHLANCIISATNGRSNATVLARPVNLRRRAEPPLPEELIGNLVWTSVVPQVDEADLLNQLRESTAKIDGDFIKRMSSAGANTLFQEMYDYSDVAPGSELIFISSWCNMGLYSVDFGWGQPIWVTHTGGAPTGSTIRYANFIVLMDTRPKDGVEALLWLDEELIAALERSPDLLAYATFDQTPLL